MSTARIFKSGNSQAVRLPKEFRFRAKEVEIFRRGEEVVLREEKLSAGKKLDEAFR
ncbi:MAG: antitoxin, partial [Gammaproteobacteria bacterium]